MKNEVETEGENLQVQIYDRSRQNTAELFIFVPLLSCVFWKQHLWILLFLCCRAA